MMNVSSNSNHIGDDSVQRTSLGHRLQRALTGGPNRRFPGFHSPPGGATSTSLLANRRLALPILALLAAVTVSLLFLLPGGPLHAQDGSTIEYAEDRRDAVATYTATDPEGAAISWSVDGTDAGAFKIDGGVLTFAKQPDYETPADVVGTGDSTAAAGDNMYEVTVQATDETMQVGTHDVMVEVTNVNEAGTVTLSALRPQSATVFTAEVTDLDGDVTNPMWQWSKSATRNGSYTDIEDAESKTYTPVDDDIGRYLRASVTYTDPEGSDKPAMERSLFAVQGVRGNNDAPEFADDQDPVMDGDQAAAAREVAENTGAGEPVGAPVTAEDDNGDTLTYTLWDANGTTQTGDSTSFSIDWATGQILTKGALDTEDEASYEVVVRATDPAGVPEADPREDTNSDMVTVNITVTNVDEAPDVTGDATADFNEVVAAASLESDETSGNIAAAVVTYQAVDPENDTPITWSTSGADGSKFTVTGGSLAFKADPDFENPTDADGDNVYEVTVVATAGGKAGTMDVKVTVANVGETGTVTLNKVQPRVGIPVTASLTDPDNNISKLTWQWTDGSANIEGATTDTYTPKAADVTNNVTLEAVASYTDGHGASKSTTGTAANEVALDTRNRAPAFEDQDSETDGVQNEEAARKVEENTGADAADDSATDDSADNVGGPVTAEDPDPNADPLTYTLSGPDAGSFRVRQDDTDTADADEGGQIEVGAGTKLDAEMKTTYMVTVTAEDSFGAMATIDVTITVTGVDEAPDVSGSASESYAEDRTDAVATYTATDPEGAAISWSLAGTDEGAFKIDDGVLTFAKQPDYETPADVVGTGDSTAAAGDNMYEVTVQATDETMQVGTHDVMVEVTNVNEAGTVTLSALRPQSATVFTAEVTDLDGDVTNPMWQWSKSATRNGSYTDIEDAESKTYTPVDDDIGRYLRASVTYTDPEGSDKPAMERSLFAVQGVRGNNDAPEFADDQDPVMDGDQAAAAREVAENTGAGEPVGAPVTAEDDNGDTLTYTLWDANGTTQTGDSTSFSIDWATGQILTKGALDTEDEASYEVVVRATDPAGVPEADPREDTNSDMVTVNITVTNVDEAPDVTGDATADFNEVVAAASLESDETSGNIAAAVVTYQAVDPENDTPITWSTSGADGSKFTVTGGSLAFKADPDFENPTDADGDNVYEVTVVATAGGKAGTMDVKVTVANVGETGTVTLNKVQPRVGIPVTASLTDPDNNISKLTWQWTDGSANIEGATTDTYTPKAADVTNNVTLEAVASYTDGHGASKSTTGTAANEVALDTRNRAPAFEDQDSETDGVQNEEAARKVEENTGADAADDSATDDSADNVGGPVTAEDPDPNADPLTYTLSGPDAGSFRVRQDDTDTADADEGGQIEVGAGTKLDAEMKTTYMVTVTAEDSFGAMATIDVTITVTGVDEVPTIRRVASENQPPVFPSDTATRSVVEGTAAGADIGAPVTAEDPDVGDALTYTLGGTDAASFNIGRATGQLQTKAALDHSTKTSYEVTVTAADAAGLSDAITVTIDVTAVGENLPPEFPSAATTREVAENTVAGEDIGAPVAASDADDATLTYTLSGTDAASFDIARATGQLKTKADLDYETKTSYDVTVTATDGDAASDSIEVAINVTDVDEAGTGDTFVDSYDANDSGTIDRAEVGQAVRDFIGRQIEHDDVVKVIAQYFKDLRSGN